MCKLGIKPHLHLVDTIISSLYHVIVRATKILKDLLKDRNIWIFKVPFQCCKSPESFWFFFCENHWVRELTFIYQHFQPLKMSKLITSQVFDSSGLNSNFCCFFFLSTCSWSQLLHWDSWHPRRMYCWLEFSFPMPLFEIMDQISWSSKYLWHQLLHQSV